MPCTNTVVLLIMHIKQIYKVLKSPRAMGLTAVMVYPPWRLFILGQVEKFVVNRCNK